METWLSILTIVVSTTGGWAAASMRARHELRRMREELRTEHRQRLVDRKRELYEAVFEELASLVFVALRGFDEKGSAEWQERTAAQLDKLARAAFRTVVVGGDAVANSVPAISRTIALAVEQWESGGGPERSRLAEQLSQHLTDIAALMHKDLPLQQIDTESTVLRLT